AAAVSGIAFAFCPYVFARTPQIQLLMTAGLPFTMLAFHRAADRPTTSRAVVLGLVMAAQVAFCGYYAVFSMLMVGFATVTLATTRRLWTAAQYWKTIALAAAVAIVVALPVLVPYIQLQESTGFGRTLADASRFSADWRGFFAAIGGVAGLVIALRRSDLTGPGLEPSGALRLREIAILYGALGGIACW